MKKSKLNITAAVAAAASLAIMGCSPAQADWDEDSERYCVDNDGDAVPMSRCNTGNGDNSSGMFFMLWASQYKTKYPKKYKSYSSKAKSSYYKSAKTSGVVRGTGGSTGRSFSSGS